MSDSLYRYAMGNRQPWLRIRLLGPLEVVAGDRPVVVDTRKALAIVALVAAEGRPFARDELAVMFWPDADDASARGALRRTLSSLRTAIGPVGLVIDRSQVALDPATSKVDLIDFERMAASDDPTDLEAAAALARGPFMAGFALRDSPDFDDWQAACAVRVERQVGDVLDRLSAVRSEGGDASGAIDIARRRVALDPLDEPGQRRVMELLARSGDRSGAIRQYRALVALFDRELGVAPLRETTDLYEAIREDRILPSALADDPDAPSGSLTTGVARNASVTLDASPRAIPLVGRERESGAIDSSWRAASPDGRIVLIEGEAGIGKTRLAEAVADSVVAAGGVVLPARGYPGEGAIAYGPIAEALRTGLAMPDGPARLAALDETARAEIGRLVELPAGLRPVHAASTAPDSVGARVRLLEAIAAALSALVAGPAPGLLWVDDLHLADDPTREALAYLARRLRDRPMLLLLAWRREDLPSGAEAVVAELARLPSATSLVLDRLDRDGIATIVRAMRPSDADDALIDAFAADSEGLPLHVVAALASGESPGQAMPRSVHALLLERISSVSEMAAQILSTAAIIGRMFDLGTLRQASGRSEEETVEAVEELSRRGLIREVRAAAGAPAGYDFAHGRIREVAYEATSLARRRLIHRRTADALRSDAAARGQDDLARFALIAGHEREAGRATEAAAAFLAAADRAESVFANREAIEYLDAAIALGDLPDGAAAHARIGELRSRLGEYPAALAALETAAALADPPDLPGIEIALGRVQRRRGDLDAADSHLVSALAASDLAPAIRARALVERSIVALRAGDLAVARRSAAEAGALATDLHDPRLAGMAERLVGLVAQATGDLPTARAALERSLAIAADDPDPTAAIAADVGLALVLSASGAVDDAIAIAGSAIEACRRIGDRHLEAAVENHLADMLHDAGRPAASMDHLKRAVALFAEVGEGVPERDPGIWALAAW